MNVYGSIWSFVATFKAAGGQPIAAVLRNRSWNVDYATLTSSSTTYVLAQAAVTTVPTANLTFDTRASGLTGSRISASALRVALNLRDTVVPAFTFPLSASPTIIGPLGTVPSTHLFAGISDDSPPLSYTYKITPSGSSTPVRTVAQTGSGTYTPAAFDWDGRNDPPTSSLVSDGTYNASVQATDSWGNTATSSSVSVIVDLVAPSVTLTSPSSSLLSGQATLQATASDNHSGVDHVDFDYRRTFSDGTKGAWHLIGSDSSSPYAVTLRTVGLADGQIDIGMKAVDGVGNATAIVDLHAFEVRNGELLSHQPFSTERSWQAGDSLSLGVNAYWGNFTADFSGGRVDAAGPRQSIDLHYNSRNPSRDFLGWGWTFGMVDKLEFPADGSIVLASGSGARYRFASGTYAPPPGVYLTLVHNGDGTWSVTDKAGIKRSFDSAGKETSVKDRNLRTRTYTYTAGKLTSVTHPSGLSTAIAYDASNRIWTITDAGRVTTLTYNVANELTKITNADAKDFIFGYDSEHRMNLAKDPLLNQYQPAYVSSGTWDWVSTVTGPTSRSFGYSNAGAEFSRAVTDPSGSITNYVFNSAGSATQMAEPSTAWTYFQRDANQNVTQYTDELGKLWKATFDSSGNKLTAQNPEELALSKSRTWTYNAMNEALTFTDSLTPSHTWTYTYDTAGNLATEASPVDTARGKNTSYTYDTAGNLWKVTNEFTKVWTYTYDGAGRRITAATPEDTTRGKAVTYTYDSANGNLTDISNQLTKTWHYTYDPIGRKLTERNPLLQTWTNVFDANGNRITVRDPLTKETTYTYNAAGQMLSEKTPLQTISTRTDYHYDAAGNLDWIEDPDGNTSFYGYDVRGRQTTSTTARGKLTTTIYDAANRVTGVKDPLNKTTTYCYDAAGQLVRVIDPRGTETCSTTLGPSTTPYTTAFSKDLTGNVLTTTDPKGNVTRYCYDADSRSTAVTDPRASVSCGTTSSFTTTQTFDDAGRLATRTEPGRDPMTYTYDPNGRMKTVSDGTGTTIYSYNDAGRLFELTDADGNKASYLYDDAGQLTNYVDPRGNVTGALPSDYDTVLNYDATGRLRGITNQLNYKRSLTYNDDGSVTGVTDPRGNVSTPDDPAFTTGLSYFPSGRMQSVTDADGRAATYGYDADGNTSLIDEGTGSTSISWDALQRLSSATMTLDGPPSTQMQVQRTYDAVGNRSSMTDPTGTTTYGFNSLSLPMSVSGPANAVVYEGGACSSCGYDSAQNLTTASLTGPSTTLTQAFNATNRQTSLSTGWASATFTSDGRGLPDTYVDGGGYTEDLTTSPGGFPQRLQLKRTATGTIDADFVVTPDPGLRPLSITNSGVTEHTYAYFPTGGVSSEQYKLGASLQAASYTYDRAGNRITRTVGAATDTYAYSNGGTLTSISGLAATTYTYDLNGNTTLATGVNSASYSWGFNNRLSQAAKGGGLPVKFTYDGNGVVTTRQVGTTVYPYRYDGNRLEAIREVGLNSTTDKILFSYAADGTPIAMRAPGGDIFYYHYDAFGSVDRMTKGTQLAVRYIYDSYGNVVETTQGAAYTTLLADNPFRFMGRFQLKYDPQLSLYEADGRFYDPALGRYLSRDSSLSYLPCWLGTCLPSGAFLGIAGTQGVDETLGGYCHAGIMVDAKTEGFVAAQTWAECKGNSGNSNHAHIVTDDIRVCKQYCTMSADGNSPGQIGEAYTFKPPDDVPEDASSEHDHGDPVMSAQHEAHMAAQPVHALLLHQFSCDNCADLNTPAAQPLGLPCGSTELSDVKGLPNLWKDKESAMKPTAFRKDCGGASWLGESQVHFIPANHFKSPFGGAGGIPRDNYLFGWTYTIMTGTRANVACGGHEYQPDALLPALMSASVEAARDFAAYRTGTGVYCYSINGRALAKG